jgi:hypothetical protein
MPFIRRFIFSCFFITIAVCCFARQDSTGLNITAPADTFQTHLKNSLVSFYSKYPQEKIFIHTNQNVYTGGETIWYKLYAMAYGKPDALSNIAYVQLTDTSGNLIAQDKLHVSDGKAHGNIDINPQIKTGWYKLTAFTSWMMNFESQAYYRQYIFIHNPADTIVTPVKKELTKKTYQISFCPEGGDLIDGNIATIAFKAVSNDGLPARVEGTIKDNTNKIIQKFTTAHDGMGEFTMEAFAGNSYVAEVRFPDRSAQKINLPAVSAAGIYLHVSQTADKIHINLAFAGDKANSKNCILAAFQNSGQINTFSLQLQKGINEFDLQKANFSTGILRLTVFNPEGLPQAERILFINKHDLTAALKTDTLSFLPGGANAFSMTLKDGAGIPPKANLSIAVTDGDVFNGDDSQSIFSELLLSPELKGEVHNPGYYFKNESDSLAVQLDLVMLTNGWRHFSWKKVLNSESYPLKYPVERSAYFAGRVVNYKNFQATKDKLKIKLLIMNHDSTKFIGYITPDSTGSFIIKDFNHIGRSDIYLGTAEKKNYSKKLQIKIFTSLDDSLRWAKADGFSTPAVPDMSGYYLTGKEKETQNMLAVEGILLDTVNIKEKKVSPIEKLIAEHVSVKYTSDREFTLDLVNNPTADIGFINYIRGKFVNLQILGDDAAPQFIYRGGNTLGYSTAIDPSDNYMPYFYLDEAPVKYSTIQEVSLVNIAMIRFMPPPVWFAPYNGGNAGAIMVYTKKQSDEVRKMTGMSDFDHYVFNGYAITREFSVAAYDKEQTKPVYDKHTLYWNHDLNTDSNGIINFRFNNSDSGKKFKVVIQGMDDRGRLVYLEQLLKQTR